MTLTSSFLCHRLLLLIISFFLFLHTHTCFFVFSSRHVVQNSQVWSTFCWVLWCIHFHTSIIIQIRHLQCHFILFVLSFILIQNERRTSTFDLPCCRLDPFDVTYYHFYTNTPFFVFFVHPHSKRNTYVNFSSFESLIRRLSHDHTSAIYSLEWPTPSCRIDKKK